MNKTKEEILEEFTKYNDAHPSYFSKVKMSEAQFDAFINTLRGFVNQQTTHLTDQIKSMEGKVKELRDENEIQGNYNDMLIKELESLQKENERLYDALSNIMNNERWLEMNIDTVNNLLSKHA